MARRRMIDPSIWEDEDVGSLSLGAFKIFVACISNADDHGRLKGSPTFVRGMAFRYADDVTIPQVQGWLEELDSCLRSFAWYTINGRQYIALMRWLDYQTIRDSQDSLIPTPHEPNAASPQRQGDDDVTTLLRRCDDDAEGTSPKGKERKGSIREEKGSTPSILPQPVSPAEPSAVVVEEIPDVDTQQPEPPKPDPQSLTDDIQRIFGAYRDNIHEPFRRLHAPQSLPMREHIPKARERIRALLKAKTFTANDLVTAIEHAPVYCDGWLQSNGGRGITWFFASAERVQRYVDFIPREITDASVKPNSNGGPPKPTTRPIADQNAFVEMQKRADEYQRQQREQRTADAGSA